MVSYDADSSDEEIDYSTDPVWADINPIPQDDGPEPLAQIAYPPEYSLAMSYLRGVMSVNDHTPRVINLTSEIIGMNPAHYTVWGYRFKTLQALDKAGELTEESCGWTWAKELAWVQSTAKKYEKNYQIWHHRQLIVDHVGDSTRERDKTEEMFALDSKNYHVWTYRQWLVKRFNLFDAEELAATEKLLEQDVRNNSAWNHRYFIVLGRLGADAPEEGIIEREIEFAKEAILKAPQNPSPWNYLKATLGKGKIELATLKPFCERFSPVLSPDEIKSSHALDILSEIYDQAGEAAKAEKALELLASKFDPVRKNYWRYRLRTLISKNPPRPTEAAAAVEATA